MKMKESKKVDKNWMLALKVKMRNMKLLVISVIVRVIGIVPKLLEKRLEKMEIRGKIRTIKTTALLKTENLE